MDASDPDVAARGRALFEQLRAEREGVMGSGSSVAGSPLPSAPHHAGPLLTEDGLPPAANGMSAGDDPSGAEIHAGANHDVGPDRDSEDSRSNEGGPAEGVPAGAEMATDPQPVSATSSDGEIDGEIDGVPAGVPAGADQAAALAGGEQPVSGGGSPENDPPAVGSTPARGPDSPDGTPHASQQAPSGDGVPTGDDPAGQADADPPPPPPAVAGPDTFHVEHDAPAGDATPAEPSAPVEHDPVTPSPPVSEGRARHPAADLALPRIIAVANQKGGVGKTTTAVNLGAALAELGFRTLVVDLDPQGNATTGLGINARNLDSSIYDVLMHEMPIDECIEPTSVRNLFVAPATIDLAGAEIELVPAFSRELRLKRALAEVADAYEFTIIDCPPSLGLLTVNGLAAATEVIVPIQCEYYALEGLGQLMRNVNLVQSNLNPTLLLSAIILTMYDARTKLADQVATEVRDHFGTRVCRNVVPRTVRLSEAPSFGQPIIVFDPSSRGALAYRELAKEVSGGAPQRVG